MVSPMHPVLMFLQAFVTQAMGYFVVVGLLYLVVWRWGAARFRGARIQAKQRFGPQQLRFEVKNTLVTLAVGTCSALLISVLVARGGTRLSETADAQGLLVSLATFFGFLVFNDAWFYFWHRLMHHPKLFRWVHAVHHKSVDVNPFSSYSFHAVEALILGGWVVPAVMLVPTSMPVLAGLQIIGLSNNVMSHLGYEFLPRWFARVPPFSWLNTSTFHNLHHTQLNANYGLMFRWWDKVFGTEAPDYTDRFVQRGAALPEAAPAPERP